MQLELKQKLEQALPRYVEHLVKLKADKKSYVASYNEQIKGANKRMEAVSKAIKDKSVSELNEVFEEDELRRLFSDK